MEKNINKNYLIVNIIPSRNVLYCQVNNQRETGYCYNIEISNHKEYVQIDGFMIPTFSGNYSTSIYGNRETRTMMHCLKVLPKVHEDKMDLLQFLTDLIKREKLTHYQINVNGSMDYSQAKQIDMSTLADILKTLNTHNFPIVF